MTTATSSYHSPADELKDLRKQVRKLQEANEKLNASLMESRENEEKYKTITNNLSIGIYRNTPGSDGTFIEVNQALLKMLGYRSKREFMALSVSSMYQMPGNRIKSDRELHRKGYLKREIPLRKKDGTVFIAAVSSKAIKDVKGKILFYDGIVEDVTTRRLSETALEASRRLLLTSYEAIPDAVMAVDKKGIIILCNHAVGKILGYEPAELVGQEYTILFDQKWLKNTEGQKGIISTILRKGFFVSDDFSFRKKNGETFPASFTVAAYRDNRGKYAGIVGTIRDMTERKKIEKKILDQNEFLTSVINSFSHPLYVINADDCSIEIANNASRLGKRKTTCYRWHFGLHAPCDGTQRTCPVREIKKTGEPIDFEYHHVDSKGKDVYHEVHAYPVLSESGRLRQVIEYLIDITDRKKTEITLQQSEEKYRALFNLSPVGILIEDSEGNILDVNPVFCDILGYSRKELLGQKVHLIADPLMQKDINPNLEKILNGEELKHVRKNVRKDGKTIYVELNEKRIMLPGGERGVICLSQDITERMEKEEALQLEHARSERHRKFMEALLSAIPNPVFYKDTECRYLGCNKAFLDFVGTTLDKLIGKTVFDIWPYDFAQEYHHRDKELLKTKQTQIYEWKIKDRSGKERFVIFTKDVFYDEQGKVGGIIGSYTDITERKKSEEALQDSEETYKGLFDSVTDAIYIQDERGIFLDVNEGAVKMYKYPREEFRGRTPEFLSAPGRNDVNKVAGYVAEAFHGVPQAFEFWGLDSQGRVFPKEVRLNKGKFFGKDVVFAIARDITQTKKYEQDLMEAKEKAVESDRLKSSFLANMSHEIRTPMNVIIGFSQLLSDAGLPEESRDNYLRLIQSSGQDLLRLIDDIIDISKIEAGQLKISKENFYLNDVLMEINSSFIEYLKLSKNKSHLKISYIKPMQCEKDIIHTDEGRFRQIMNNLLNNAIKFTDRGSIDFGYQANFLSEKPEYVFRVKDTGIGIPADKLEVIFESFRQVHVSDTKLFGGAGLGLAITRKLVEVLGGQIRVESSAAEGSTFYFTLPV